MRHCLNGRFGEHAIMRRDGWLALSYVISPSHFGALFGAADQPFGAVARQSFSDANI